MKKYDKLVRDKIPDIIRSSGRECQTRIADRSEMQGLLIAKAKEEISEFEETPNVEELADLAEVIGGLLRTINATPKDFQEAIDAKRMERGGFNRGIVLLSVEEKQSGNVNPQTREPLYFVSCDPTTLKCVSCVYGYVLHQSPLASSCVKYSHKPKDVYFESADCPNYKALKNK